MVIKLVLSTKVMFMIKIIMAEVLTLRRVCLACVQ